MFILGRLHSDNLDKIRKDEQMQNSIHHKQSVTDSGQGSARHDGPVHKFGFHMDTYYGDSFHTNGGQWEASWQVRLLIAHYHIQKHCGEVITLWIRTRQSMLCNVVSIRLLTV